MTGTQFITNNKGEKQSVVLPLKAYEKMLADLEELEDIRQYDAVKSRNEPRIALEDYLLQRKKRKHARL